MDINGWFNPVEQEAAEEYGIIINAIDGTEMEEKRLHP